MISPGAQRAAGKSTLRNASRQRRLRHVGQPDKWPLLQNL